MIKGQTRVHTRVTDMYLVGVKGIALTHQLTSNNREKSSAHSYGEIMAHYLQLASFSTTLAPAPPGSGSDRSLGQAPYQV